MSDDPKDLLRHAVRAYSYAKTKVLALPTLSITTQDIYDQKLAETEADIAATMKNIQQYERMSENELPASSIASTLHIYRDMLAHSLAMQAKYSSWLSDDQSQKLWNGYSAYKREYLDPILSLLEEGSAAAIRASEIDPETTIEGNIDHNEIFARLLLLEAITHARRTPHPLDHNLLSSASYPMSKYRSYKPNDDDGLMFSCRIDVRNKDTFSAMMNLEIEIMTRPDAFALRELHQKISSNEEVLKNTPPMELAPEWFEPYPMRKLP